MGGKRIYNHEIFPSGTRVKVHAPNRNEGSDHDWHGHTGTLIRNGMWTLVKMDKRHHHWPSDEVTICNHNLFRADQQSKNNDQNPQR